MFMLKQKDQFETVKMRIAVFTAVIVVLVGGLLWAGSVRADNVSDQIQDLQAQNASYRDTLNQLSALATSYQNAIVQLQAQIDSLQQAIVSSQHESDLLQEQIDQAQKELDRQRSVLGKNIKAMYLEGDVSTLEILASSNNLSDYVNKAEYRNSVQSKVKETLDKINRLKQDLQTKQNALIATIKDQETKKSLLVESQSQQSQMLSFNQTQQADYNQKTKDNQSKIDALIASQRRANFNPDGGYYFIRFPGNVSSFNPDSYPYRNAGFGMSPGPGCVDNDGPDTWGYCTRQCVSYAAWAVVASGRSAPMYWGNARDWVSAAYARGIPVYRTPQPGDIAISTSGYWGHAMYVTGVSGNNFTTSEYNTYLTGQLSYQTRSF